MHWAEHYHLESSFSHLPINLFLGHLACLVLSCVFGTMLGLEWRDQYGERERVRARVCRDEKIVVYNESGLQVIRKVYLKRFLLGVGVKFFCVFKRVKVGIAEDDNKDFLKV